MEAQSHQQSHNNAASPPHKALDTDSHRSGFPILESSEAMAEKEYPEAMMCFLDKKKHANDINDSDDSLRFESREDEDDVELHLQLNIESTFSLNLAAADQRQALDLNAHPLVHNTEPFLSKLWETGSTHSDFHEGVVEETEDKGLDLELRIGVSLGRP